MLDGVWREVKGREMVALVSEREEAACLPSFAFIHLPIKSPLVISNQSGFLSYISTYWFVVIVTTLLNKFDSRFGQVQRKLCCRNYYT